MFFHQKMCCLCWLRSFFSSSYLQAITALKKGAYLLKYGRRGKPKFCPFRLSNVSLVFCSCRYILTLLNRSSKCNTYFHIIFAKKSSGFFYISFCFYFVSRWKDTREYWKRMCKKSVEEKGKNAECSSLCALTKNLDIL